MELYFLVAQDRRTSLAFKSSLLSGKCLTPTQLNPQKSKRKYRQESRRLIKLKLLVQMQDISAKSHWTFRGRRSMPLPHESKPLILFNLEWAFIFDCWALVFIDSLLLFYDILLVDPSLWMKIGPLSWLYMACMIGRDLGYSPSEAHHTLMRFFSLGTLLLSILLSHSIMCIEDLALWWSVLSIFSRWYFLSYLFDFGVYRACH